MMKLKAKIVQLSYSVELSKNQWDKLDSLKFDDVEKALDETLAFNLDYDGHFGRYFYFDIDSDKKATVPKILKILEKILT